MFLEMHAYLNNFALRVCMLTIITHSTVASKVLKCKPRKSLVSTCQDGAVYQPPYLLLKRCQGGVRNTNMYSCQATKTKHVNETIMDEFGRLLSAPFEEHVKCKERCICGNCRRKRGKPKCDNGLVWDDVSCRCVCQCSVNDIVAENDSKKSQSLSSGQLAAIICSQSIFTFIALVVVMSYLRSRNRRKIYTQLLSSGSQVSYSNLDAQ